MVPAGALRGLLVAACAWLTVACVDGVEVSELLEDGWSQEEIIDFVTNRVPPSTQLPYDTRWLLTRLDGNPIREDTSPSLYISSDNIDFAAYDGCNSHGTFRRDGVPSIVQTIVHPDGRFTPHDQLISSIVSCEPKGIEQQADRYIEALLVEGRWWRVEGQRLEILDEHGKVTLVFSKYLPLPGQSIDLLGSSWRLQARGGGRPATMFFADEHVVIGSTGCRDYLGTYSTHEDTIGIHLVLTEWGYPRRPPKISSEGRVCSEEALDREWRIMGGGEYAVDDYGGRVVLRFRAGRTVSVFEPMAAGRVGEVGWTLRAIGELGVSERPPGAWFEEMTEIWPKSKVTISFGEGGAWGSVGCNGYIASASIGDEAISIDDVVVGTKDCGDWPGLAEQRKAYLDMLPQVTGFKFTYGHMIMYTDEGVYLLFKSKPF